MATANCDSLFLLGIALMIVFAIGMTGRGCGCDSIHNDLRRREEPSRRENY